MKILLWLLSALLSLQCVTSQISMVESSPGIVKPSETLDITCKVTGASLTDSTNMYCVHWVRQPEGKGLDWLGRICYNDAKAYAQSLQGRLTLTRDTNKGEVYIKLTGVKSEESGKYYCARETPTYYFDIWGPGTSVTITSATQSAPSVFPLVSCSNSLSTDTVTIGCLSTGYLPTPVDVQWNSGSIKSGIKNFPAVLDNKGTYLSANLLNIPTSDWTSKKYECNVHHKPTGVKITKEIEACSIKTSSPKVEVMQASCGENGSVDLVCHISGYVPKDIKIQWLLNGEPTSIIPSNSTPYKDDDGTFGSHSKVSVPKDDWNAGDTYTCKVNHPASETRNEDTIQKCPVPGGIVPKVVVLPPSPKDILITKQPKLICQVSQVESPDSLTIKWSREDGKKPQEFSSEPERDYSGRYNVKHTLKLSLSDWSSAKQFTCIVQNSDLPSPIEKSIKYTEVEATEPSVYVFAPHPEELLTHDFVTLICHIKGFKPRGIYTQWLKNGIVQDEEYYKNTEPIQQDDEDTYYLYSTLTIEKSDWNRGSTFTCSAVHNKITSKDIKKSREYILWECSSEDDDDSLWSTAVTFITLFLISFLYSATITIVKVKWFISRILQFDRHNEHFVTVLDAVTQ